MTIEVYYFDESKYLLDLDFWKNHNPPPFSTSLSYFISPQDQSWNYYFKSKFIETSLFSEFCVFAEIFYVDPNSKKGLTVFDIDNDLLIKDITEKFYSFKSILIRDEILGKNCLDNNIKKSLMRHLKLRTII